MTWHRGRYHLFFQHLPGQVEWGPAQHWGHAVSEDLRRWEEQSVVLTPDDDDGGVWSGTVVDHPSAARLFYTATQTAAPDLGVVRAAHPTDAEWTTWRKDASFALAPDGVDLVAFRDPFVIRDGGEGWRMLVGGGRADGTPLVLTWVSPDLETWAYDGVLASPGEATSPLLTGTVWECPQLIEVDEQWVLLVSVMTPDGTGHEAYAVGRVERGRFEGGPWRRLTWGPGPYAGTVFRDRDQRPCLMHWIRGVADPAGEWAGSHSVAQVLRLEGDRVVVEPHPAVADACEPLAPGQSRRVGSALLAIEGDDLVVTAGGDRWTMPCRGEPVSVLADPPILEVFGPLGVAAAAV